mmetsp:Transcript_35048/g.100940  ORF Transcript_35048/g.100940 Transcript_35048/m.100940 type:complete len:299 (+) Transcript_35048:264-1160(+)
MVLPPRRTPPHPRPDESVSSPVRRRPPPAGLAVGDRLRRGRLRPARRRRPAGAAGCVAAWRCSHTSWTSLGLYENMSKSSFAAAENMSSAGAALGFNVGLPPSMPRATSAFLFSMYFGVFLSCQPNWITMAVRFSSEPFWNAVRTMFFAASSASSQCLLAQSTMSWLCITLVMPSVASTRKRSLSVIGKIFTSGSAVDNEEGALKNESPSDRVIAKPWYSLREAFFDEPGFAGAAILQAPRTLRTRPPARSILFFSSIRSGLWSSETATACPARQRMARESPMFAITSRRAVPSLGLP